MPHRHHPIASRSEIEALGEKIWNALSERIPRCTSFANTDVQNAVIASSQKISEIYLDAIIAGEMPPDDVLGVVTEITRQRLAQGFGLDVLQRSVLVQAEVIWGFASSHLPEAQLGSRASMMLQLIDRHGVLQTAVHQQAVPGRSVAALNQTTRALLQQIADNAYNEELAAETFSFLNYDLTRVSTAVIIGSPASEDGWTQQELRSFYACAAEMRARGLEFLAAPIASGYAFITPSTSLSAIDRMVSFVFSHVTGLGPEDRVGVGSDLPGLIGVEWSLAQAHRARSLGTLLNPQQVMCRYQEYRMLDIFKQEKGVLDHFVWEVLGPLIRLDQTSGSNLIDTLQLTFDNGWNRKAAAEALGIHSNTLDYRIGKIQNLLGVTLNRNSLPLKVLLALKLLPLVKHPEK